MKDAETAPNTQAEALMRRKIGPFDLVRRLVVAPGASLFEARDARHHPLLLQVASLRAPSTAVEHELQRKTIDRIQREADALAQPTQARLVDQGAQFEDDGACTIYFALPWREGAARLGHASAHIRSEEHLVLVARALAEHVLDQHADGRTVLLLSDALVLVEPTGAASLVGLSIHISPESQGPGMQPALWAPEEQLRRTPTKSGDLWRLGRTIMALARERTGLSAELRSIIDALADPDPTLRIPSAAHAVARLAGIELSGENSKSAPHAPLDPRRERAGRIAPGDTIPSAPPLPADTDADGAGIADAPTLMNLRGQAEHAPLDVETLTRSARLAPVPSDTMEASTGESENEARLTPFDFPLETGPGGTIIGLRRVGPGGTIMGALPQARAFLEARAEALKVEPRAASTRRESASPRIDGAIVERLSGRSTPLDPSNAKDSSDEEPTSARPFARRALVPILGLVTTASLLVSAASLSFGRIAPARSPEPARLDPRGEVRLDVTPTQALVIAETDGRVLGRPPLSFLVPKDRPTTLLVTAEGHEPQRILLPTRGRVMVSLAPLEPSLRCEVELRTPSGAILEPVAAKVEVGARTRIPGALIMRSPSRGAWLVACPELGGRTLDTLTDHPKAESVEVSIRSPLGLSIFVDGDTVGKTPSILALSTGFHVVRLEDRDGANVEHWMPIETNTTVDMPAVRPTGSEALAGPTP